MSKYNSPLVEITIDKIMLDKIHELRATMPKELSKSFSKGENTIYGCAGEIIVLEWIGGAFVGNYDYDILIDDNYNVKWSCDEYYRTRLTPQEGKGLRVEVKSKRVKSEPKLHYSNSILRFSSHQDCDRYVFVRVMEDLSKAWLCGVCTPQWFYKGATFHAKNEFDLANGFTFPADCWNRNIGCFVEGSGSNGYKTSKTTNTPDGGEKVQDMWV